MPADPGVRGTNEAGRRSGHQRIETVRLPSVVVSSATLQPPPAPESRLSQPGTGVALDERTAAADRSAPIRRPARRARRAPDALLLAGGIAVICLLVKLAWPRFTWFGDNAESFF